MNVITQECEENSCKQNDVMRRSVKMCVKKNDDVHDDVSIHCSWFIIYC